MISGHFEIIEMVLRTDNQIFPRKLYRFYQLRDEDDFGYTSLSVQDPKADAAWFVDPFDIDGMSWTMDHTALDTHMLKVFATTRTFGPLLVASVELTSACRHAPALIDLVHEYVIADILGWASKHNRDAI